MISSQEREICGASYTTTTLPARRALKVGAEILRFIGPAIGALGGAVKVEDGKIVDVQEDVIPVAVKALVANLDSEKVVNLILKILEGTTRVDPEAHKREEVWKPEIFDTVYAGNLGELFAALKFVLEVSLGSFFGGSRISGLFAKALAAADRMMPGDE